MTKPHSWFRFWLRRYFRIAPAYYLSLLIAVCFSSYYLGGYEELRNMNIERWVHSTVYDPSRIIYDLKNIILHITFLFGLNSKYSFSTFLPDWSLSLEMQFYFVFPFIVLLMRKLGIIKSILGLTLLSLAITWTIYHLLQISWFYEPSLLSFKVQYFLAGVILYYLLNYRILIKYKLLLIILALFLLLIESRFTSYSIVIIFVTMLLIGTLEVEKKLPEVLKHILESKYKNFMSDSSYSVYLFHGFFISFSGLIISKIEYLKQSSFFTHTIFIWIFTILTVYPLVYLIFKSVEKNGMWIGKKVINYFFPISTRN